LHLGVPPRRSRLKIGLISDTHGLLRPEALRALRGSRHIIHAGDIGDAAILEALRAIAPLTAVRGNNDRERWARTIPETAQIEPEGTRIYVIHNIAELAIDPVAAGVQAVVSGHSHRPHIERKDGVLYINPGSAGPRRFSLPVSVGTLNVRPGSIKARLITLFKFA
jgi:putative phosphoesterase